MVETTIDTAKVYLWGSLIGAVTWLPEREIGVFQYDPDFAQSNIQVAPLKMPLSINPYEFPALNPDTFKGLPGLVADSLPDKFGNEVINAWLASQGRLPQSFTPVERLCYTGKRGMGALEFQPAIRTGAAEQRQVDLDKLVALANQVLDERRKMSGALGNAADLEDILRVGTSAGGARAKAILAWNPATDEFRSGQVGHEFGFQYWLLKFDGVSNNRDRELADPQGYGLVEFAYYKMALKAGLEMMECRLHQENGRCHFMTRRFDRGARGEKIHMQTLGAMAHFDYKQAGGYSYEQALQIMKQLGLTRQEQEQQVRRAMFNVVGRNQDDHVKNITFWMGRNGDWHLSPAYDVIYSYNPSGSWTSRHQMSINGKREAITRADLVQLAALAGMKHPAAEAMLDQVIEAVKAWPEIAADTGIKDDRIDQIKRAQRLDL